MAKFKPTPKPEAEDANAFIKGAETRSVVAAMPSAPWAGLDPDAKPTSGINLRLNEYQLARLRELARREDRSMQYIARKCLFAMIDDALKDG